MRTPTETEPLSILDSQLKSLFPLTFGEQVMAGAVPPVRITYHGWFATCEERKTPEPKGIIRVHFKGARGGLPPLHMVVEVAHAPAVQQPTGIGFEALGESATVIRASVVAVVASALRVDHFFFRDIGKAPELYSMEAVLGLP